MKTYVAVPSITDDQDLDIGHIRDVWTTWMNTNKDDIKVLENKLAVSQANADNAINEAEKLYKQQISDLKNALALASSSSSSSSSNTDSTSSLALYAAELEKIAKDKEALQNSITGIHYCYHHHHHHHHRHNHHHHHHHHL